MTDFASEELSDFYHYLWHEDKAFVYLPYKQPDGSWIAEDAFFLWPKMEAAVIRHTLQHAAIGDDVYHAPALFKRARPVKENVLGSYFLWADMDGNAPPSWPIMQNDEILIPKPSLIVQSSLPGHEHAYWELNTFLSDISVLEDRNRAIAYALNADTSGWDADQVLRPPHTRNNKRNAPVTIKHWEL